MRFVLCLLILLAFHSHTNYAQDLPMDPWDNLPQLSLKSGLISLIADPNPHIHLAVETKLKQKITMQHELAYMNSVLNPFLEYDIDPMWGFRIKSEMRFYFKASPKGKTFTYFGPELFYKYQSYNRVDWLCRFDCTYFEKFEYDRMKHLAGLNVKFGWMSILTNRFLIDYGLGIGVRYLTINSDLPEDASTNISDGFISSREDGKYITPGFNLHFKIGMVPK